MTRLFLTNKFGLLHDRYPLNALYAYGTVALHKLYHIRLSVIAIQDLCATNMHIA
jgi:hypothetical protein